MSTDLSALPVHALSAGLTAGQFSSVDLVDACLARIAALEPKLQAFVHVHEAEARQAAEAADKAIRAGQAVGPLHGIPIAIKDLVEVKDHPTAAGCAVWRQRMSAYNATLVEKLLAAGMRIVLGQDPYGGVRLWPPGAPNQHMGTPWNPLGSGHSSHAGRVVVRFRRGGGGAHGALRHRHRYRRLGAHSRRLVRHYRIEDQHRAHQHPWRDPAQSDFDTPGPITPQRGRLRHPVGAFARKRSRRSPDRQPAAQRANGRIETGCEGFASGATAGQ